jgi:hypothetical protein
MNIQFTGTGCDVALSMIVVKEIKENSGMQNMKFFRQSLCINYVIHYLIQQIAQSITNNCHLFPPNLF